MAAVLQAASGAEGASIRVTRSLSGQDCVLPATALAFLGELHRRFEPTRQARLADRVRRQGHCDAGALPDFRADTARIRSGSWRVAPLPPSLLDRRVEITGRSVQLIRSPTS